MNTVLIGFKSCGKSTVAKHLAALNGMAYTDTDTLIERRFESTHGKWLSCRDIYAQHGAELMRRLESEVFAEAAALEHTVIAPGGGIVLAPENRLLLRATGVCIFLDTPLAVLEQRLAGANSPLFARQGVAEVHAERLPLYAETAHIRIIPAPDYAPVQIARHIMTQLREYAHGRQ